MSGNHHWSVPESITVHPADRKWLTRQLPTAFLYGEPVPQDIAVIDDPDVIPGTVRIRTDGRDVSVILGEPEDPRMPHWKLAEPYPHPSGLSPKEA